MLETGVDDLFNSPKLATPHLLHLIEASVYLIKSHVDRITEIAQSRALLTRIPTITVIMVGAEVKATARS